MTCDSGILHVGRHYFGVITSFSVKFLTCWKKLTKVITVFCVLMCTLASVHTSIFKSLNWMSWNSKWRFCHWRPLKHHTLYFHTVGNNNMVTMQAYEFWTPYLCFWGFYAVLNFMECLTRDVFLGQTDWITNSVALVHERTIPAKLPPFVGEVSANFCG
jgi:hypothetical protein